MEPAALVRDDGEEDTAPTAHGPPVWTGVRVVPVKEGAEVWLAAGRTRSCRMYHSWYTLWTPAVPRSGLAWRYRRSVRVVTPGATMVVQPGEVWSLEASAPVDLRILHVAPAVVEQLAAPYGLRHSWPELDEPLLAARLGRLTAALGDAPAHRARELGGLLRVVCQPAPRPPLGDVHQGCERAVRRAREFVETHHAARLRLDEVAAFAARSKYHLARSFHAKVGVSIWELVRRVRCDRAMGLLRQGWRPTDVATAVGFADQAHLTRSMRELLGITPGVYQRAVREP